MRIATRIMAALVVFAFSPVASNGQDPPPVTDADRAAAFPPVEGHATHGASLHYFVLSANSSGKSLDGGDSRSWDTKGWVGGDRNRLWFRTEGDVRNAAVTATQSRVLFGRSFARWWDMVAGIRQDVRPGPAQKFRREFAPYVGLVWSRTFFGTADFAEAAGETSAGSGLALGIRTWF
jgi:uncharacterized protein involved in copper resistance